MVDYRRFCDVYDARIQNGAFVEERDYYRHFRDRYWNTFRYVERLLPAGGARMLDVGSGQFAILAKHLLGAMADVADLDTRHTDVLSQNGVGFHPIDLSREIILPDERYDMVVLAEVIEHVPSPPYVVFSNLRDALRPGGTLLVTTPNLYRLRNAIRMVRGKRIFDLYRVPEVDGPLGHFIEYAKDQLEWHFERASYEIVVSELVQLMLGGASIRARLARRLLWPLLTLRPLWRDNLVVVGRRP